MAADIRYADDFKAEELVAVTNEYPVVVFIKSDCIYCQQAIDLLENDGIDTYVVNMEDVTDRDAVKRVLDDKSGNVMVPKIFVKGKYIGMLTQLQEMEASGKLMEEVDAPRKIDEVPPLPEPKIEEGPTL